MNTLRQDAVENTVLKKSPTIVDRKKPLISVVIPTHNRAKLLKRALESILALEYGRENLEIIVVDDGSTDHTIEIVKAFPVKYLYTKCVGNGEARNLGIRAATGDFIAFLDDDDEWLSINLTPQLEMFDLHPEYGAVFAKAVLVGPDGKPYGEPVPGGQLASGWIFDDLLKYWPQIGTVLVRTSVVRNIGTLDPTLRGDAEWDWFLRIAQSYQIGRIDDPVILFNQRESNQEKLHWIRYPETLKIFRRHTKNLRLSKKIKLERLFWKHRGWWANVFLTDAAFYKKNKKYLKMFRCLYYTFRASPPHSMLWVLKTLKHLISFNRKLST